jgi:hypothetical protein
VPRGPDVFGAIKNGWIIVHGPLRQVRLDRFIDHIPNGDIYGICYYLCITDPKTRESCRHLSLDMVDRDSTTDEKLKEISQDIWCLALGAKRYARRNLVDKEDDAIIGYDLYEEGLLLTRAGEGVEGFKRIGVWYDNGGQGEFNVSSWERRQIKVI